MKNGKPITVGLELEMLSQHTIAQTIAERHNFGRRYDHSIADKNGVILPRNGPTAGVELVTPIMQVDTSIAPDCKPGDFDFLAVKPVVSDLTMCAKEYNSSCGLHVHLGRPNGETTDWNPRRIKGAPGGPASEWKPSHVRTMLLIGLAIEDRIFAVVPESRKVRQHCATIGSIYSSDEIQSYYPLTGLVPRKFDNKQRYCWLNLIETARPADPAEERIGYASSKPFGTFEIRALGETVDPDYIFTWVKLWVKIAAAVAYLPSESAALRCLYSNWLKADFDQLAKFKQQHEETVAPHVRSKLPVRNGATNGNSFEE